MTTPPRNGNPQDDDPNDSSDASVPSYPSYPIYPATPHPEDEPAYGNYDRYAAYAASSTESDVARERGTGSVDVMRGVRWGFRTVANNWTVWVLGALAAVVVYTILASIMQFVFMPIPPSSTVAPVLPAASAGLYQALILVQALIVGAASIFVARGSLHQVDRQKMGWGDFFRQVNFWPTLGLVALIYVVSLVISFLFSIIAFASGLAAILTVIAVIALRPLIFMMPLYLVENRAGFAESIAQGFQAGKRNYLSLFLYNVTLAAIGAVISVLILVLLLIPVLGPLLFFVLVVAITLFAAPALLLADAHIYRQATGGAVAAPLASKRR